MGYKMLQLTVRLSQLDMKKPGTKYHYQFFEEPVNTFTTLSASVDFNINTYAGGSTANITITNLSDEAIKDWKLTWTFNDTAQISGLWCANYTQVDRRVEVTPMPWNRTIAAKAAITLGFCSTSQITKPNDISLLLPNNIAEAEPLVNPTGDPTALVNANSQFAFDIFRQINSIETGKNVFISPFSISTALAMLYQGAGSDTRNEIAKALNYNGIDIGILNSDYKSLLNYLKNVDPFVTLSIANSIWYQAGFNVKPGFLNTNNEVFGSEIAYGARSLETALQGLGMNKAFNAD
jgi:hypothetical protein